MAIRAQGYIVTPHGEVTVIMDAPQGSALINFETKPIQKTIFITDNPCGEYWLDVLKLGVTGFIIGNTGVDNILLAAHSVHRDQSFIKHPPFRSALTPKERSILRLVADGLEDNEIANRFNLKSNVVRNYVSTIMSKLRATHPDMRMSSRIHLNNYYWGLWHVLRAEQHDNRNMTDVISQV
jgi:DNA-binding NarL/FixJ family response regulator